MTENACASSCDLRRSATSALTRSQSRLDLSHFSASVFHFVIGKIEINQWREAPTDAATGQHGGRTGRDDKYGMDDEYEGPIAEAIRRRNLPVSEPEHLNRADFDLHMRAGIAMYERRCAVITTLLASIPGSDRWTF